MSPAEKGVVAFSIPIVLAFLSQVAGRVIAKQLRTTYREILDEAAAAEIFQPGVAVTNSLLPESQVAIALWVVDASQILGGVLGPVLGVVLLQQALTWPIVCLLALAFVATFGGFLWFAGESNPRTYHRDPITVSFRDRPVRPVGSLTPVALVVVVANAACAALAAVLA